MANYTRPHTCLRDIRKQHNLTQEALAELIGMDKRSIQRWESGHMPSAYARQKLCMHLQVTPAKLGFLSDENRPSQDEKRMASAGQICLMLLLFLLILIVLAFVIWFWT